ncbi:MAG: peptidylprolyl isomerase [Cyclobacteriaceae bacterium]|nr:peptidylprolyl isomerase [Cyclobacteriaceae bacterium]
MKNILSIMIGLVLTLSACAKKDYLVTIKTSYGDIKVILYDQTPNHKESFVKLAKNGDYDSTAFHRVIKDFMIQGGDINARPGNEKKIDYKIPAEFVDTLFHHKGALAAAREGDNRNPTKASGIQWYIVQGVVYSEDELTTDMQKMNDYMKQLMQMPEYVNLQEELSKIYYEQGQEAYGNKLMEMKPILEKEFNVTFEKEFPEDRLKLYTTIGGTPHLDGAYTVFGRVVEGLDVVDKIAAVETAAMDKPVENIFMTMEVEEINLKKFKKLYGTR